MEKDFHKEFSIKQYVALFFIIFFAVVLGNLTASGIKTWVVLSGIEVAVKDFNTEIENQNKVAKQLNQKSSREARLRALRQQESNRIANENARKKTTTGKLLSRKCNEWTYASTANSNSFASEEKTKYCGAYDRYIKHGSIPSFKIY